MKPWHHHQRTAGCNLVKILSNSQPTSRTTNDLLVVGHWLMRKDGMLFWSLECRWCAITGFTKYHLLGFGIVKKWKLHQGQWYRRNYPPLPTNHGSVKQFWCGRAYIQYSCFRINWKGNCLHGSVECSVLLRNNYPERCHLPEGESK